MGLKNDSYSLFVAWIPFDRKNIKSEFYLYTKPEVDKSPTEGRSIHLRGRVRKSEPSRFDKVIEICKKRTNDIQKERERGRMREKMKQNVHNTHTPMDALCKVNINLALTCTTYANTFTLQM